MRLREGYQICVFASSGENIDTRYFDQAAVLGRRLGHAGMNLIYGGTKTGSMKFLADAARESGACVTGVIDAIFIRKGCGSTTCNRLIACDSLAERKRIMFEMADAFIVLPGGIGTMDEMFDIMARMAVYEIRKPIVIGNLFNFYDQILDIFESLMRMKFAPVNFRRIYSAASTVEIIMMRLQEMLADYFEEMAADPR